MSSCRRFVIVSVFVIAVAQLSTSQARASWAAVPLEVLADQSDVIVAGKVSKVQNAGFAVGNRPYDVAVVEIADTLKALPGVGKPKEVRIGQPGRGGIGLSTDIRFSPGQSGIWLLTKDPQRDVYWARHPSQFQPAKSQKTLAALVAAREKLDGGKAVKGLVARAELVTTKPAKGPTFYEIRFSLKNVTDKPIVVCDYVGHQPLQLDWIGPDGKASKSNHYAWLALARLAGVRQQDFVTIPPSGVRFLGPRSQSSGIFFQTGQRNRNANTAEAGKHTVTVRYANTDDGRQFVLKSVWTGTVTANPVALTVK